MKKLTKTQKNSLTIYTFLAISAAIFSIIIGVLFSLLTNYVSEEHHFIIKSSVWILNMFISYIIAYLIFLPIKKYIEKKKCLQIKYKFFNWFAIILALTFSVIAVCLIGGSFDYTYVVTYISVSGLIGIIAGIYTFFIKQITKRKSKVNDDKND